MTICQFFLQGRCRFGQNCRFQHTYNNDDRSSRNQINSQQLSNIVKQIVEEVISAEKGGQWPLSCFSPVKGGPNIPGWEDISPEEVRWKMYEARANGTLNQCNLEINQLYSNAEKMRNLIKERTIDRVNLIVNVLKNKNEPSTSNQFTSSLSSSNIFGGSLQYSGSQNIFRNATSGNTGSHGSIFGGSSSSTGNIFGGSNQPTGNIFGGSIGYSNSNVFGGLGSSSNFSQNAFSNPHNTNQNIFSNSSVSSQNIFCKAGEGNNQNVSNAFLSPNSSAVFQNQVSSGSIFGSNSTFFQNTKNQNQTQSNIFGGNPNENIFKTQNAFGKTNNIFNIQQEPSKGGFANTTQQNCFGSHQQSPKEFDSSVYSKLEDLNEEEILCFTSATFAFGKIPLKPPPKEYCK